MEFEKRAFFLKNLLQNVNGKQSKVNEEEVKVIFIVKNTIKSSLYGNS